MKCFLLCLLPAALCSAQSMLVPAPAPSKPLLIENVIVHTAMKDPARLTGWVLIEDGRISAMGDSAASDLPEHTQILDAQGLHLVPGFIALASQLGLVEVLQVDATDDRRETTDRTPELAPWVSINPSSALLPVARSAGILHTLVVPSGGTIPGRASVIRLDGWTTEDLAVLRDAGLVVRWPLATPIRASWMRRSSDDQKNQSIKQKKELTAFFDDARAWHAAREANPHTPGDLRFEAMGSVLRGERPVFFLANSRGQIEDSLTFAEAQGLLPIILGGADAARCLDAIKASGAAVIIDGVHRLPLARHSAWDDPFALAARLEAAGIPFAIAGGDEPAHLRALAHHAATAVAHGLSPDRALRAITSSAAELAGVGDRLGMITPGHSATFFLCDGEPLEMASPPLRAWIDGREIDLGDRQKLLFRKYRERYVQE
jgi:imidazolonepropionase-like amidohydrolase